MTGRRRYLCTGCRTNTKLLDYDENERVRMGCGLCEVARVREWVAIGSVAHHASRQQGVSR